jgi:Na+/proline symporter
MDRLRVVHLDGGFASGRWLLTGLVGGAFLSMASHGVDHLMVQRLLASPSLRDARKAVVASGVIIIAQFALFLFIGLALLAFFQGRAFAVSDEIFPTFIVEHLPAGVSGLVVAAILSVSMSSEASAMNSLASAMTLDLYGPLSGRGGEKEHMLRAGRVFTLVAGALLIGGACLFQFVQQGAPVVVLALNIASFTYGGLLGGFLLGVLSKRADQRDAITGITVAIVVMSALWFLQQLAVIPRLVDGLWFSLIGSAITVAVGSASAAYRAPSPL